MKRLFSTIVVVVFMAVNAMATLSDGLVAHYEFEGNAKDSSGNGNDLLERKIEYKNGVEDSLSAYTNGIDSTLKRDNFYISGNKITFSTWVKFEDIKEINPIIDHHAAYAIWYKKSNKLTFYIYGLDNMELEVDYTIQKNKWYYITAIYDGELKKIYVNGTLIGSEQSQGLLPNSSYPFFIMSDETAVYRYSNGFIDNFRIYNRALSETEIQELYRGSTCNDRYDEGFNAGKEYCIANPSACGITAEVASKEDISISVKEGWQLVGVSGSIKVSDFSRFFDASCVSEVYYFNNSWYHYTLNSTNGLIDIGPNQGFWIKGRKECALNSNNLER